MNTSKLWATSEDGSIEYVSLTKDLLPYAIKAMQESFYLHENVCVAFDVPKQPECFPEMDVLLERAALDGVSIAAVDKTTGEVAGVSFNKLEEPDDCGFYKDYPKTLKYSASRGFAQWVADTENLFDIFEHCKASSLFEIMFLGITSNYRKRGIAKKLFQISIEIARQLKNGFDVKVALHGEILKSRNPPQIVSGIFTSLVTQKIAKDLNFEIGAKISFAKFFNNGKSFVDTIGQHTPYFTYEYLQL